MKKDTASQVIGAQMVSATDGSAFTGMVTCYVTGDGGTQAVGSVGSGVCTHEGNGYHTYAPAQAETNYDLIAFTFIGSGAVPATIQVFTGYPQTGDAYARIGAPAGASVSADIAEVKAETATILDDTDDIGVAGAGLTALPWNAAWDAEVQSEATDALNVYDPPTKAELDAGLAALDDLDAAGVRAAVGLSAANLDNQLSALPTATENADELLKRDWSAVTGEAARSVLNALRFLRNKWAIASGTLTVYKEDDATSAWTGTTSSETSSDVVTGVDP